MKQEPLLMPALRGSFGDWIYYTCLMPISEVGARVQYAEEIHPNKALSELIQRSLEGPRARQIAEYLSSTKERFFNSLVLATYGGNPEWLEIGDFKSATRPDILRQVSESAMDTVGFLRLTGTEKIFAVDGQHRLAGIKKWLEDTTERRSEMVSVLLVGHKKSARGLERTRRLFTTLNKTAVPVRKRDIIALDEDDAMAIIARRLVETNPSFEDPKIAVIVSQNIPVTNRESLTTISSLYDILKLLFMYVKGHLFTHVKGQRSDYTLRFSRPSDEQLSYFEQVATSYFEALGRHFKPVGDVFKSKQPARVTEKFRGPHGGHLLFRPIGLEIFTRTVIDLAAQMETDFPGAVGLLRSMPMELDEDPYLGVLWDPNRQFIIPQGKTLARDLLRFIAGLPVDESELHKRYRLSVRASGLAPRNLPAQIR
jgi:DNA sulfur modification protein DndB